MGSTPSGRDSLCETGQWWAHALLALGRLTALRITELLALAHALELIRDDVDLAHLMSVHYTLANVLQVKVEDAGDAKTDGDVQALGLRFDRCKTRKKSSTLLFA